MKWSKEQIRNARMMALAPLLTGRGCTLKTLTDENYCVSDYVSKAELWSHEVPLHVLIETVECLFLTALIRPRLGLVGVP